MYVSTKSLLVKNQVDSKQLGDGLVAASKIVDGITQNVGNYMPKVSRRIVSMSGFYYFY